MKRLVTIIALSVHIAACGQRTTSHDDGAIVATRSSRHENIPGTHVFIIPPTGFTASASLPAFEKDDDGLLQAMDLDGGNFYTNAATFSKEKFEQKGLKVEEFRELKVNGLPGKLALIQGDRETKMYNLVFGDSTFSASIMGVYRADDVEAGEKIKQAIQTVVYDKTFKVDPFARAVFKLDDSKSVFKFARFIASNYWYTLGGVVKNSYEDDPVFTVVAIPTSGLSLRTIADDMADIVKERRIEHEINGSTNGFESLKREVFGDLKGEVVLLFQHIVLIGEDAVVMQGILDRDFDKYLIEFEKLSNTVMKR